MLSRAHHLPIAIALALTVTGCAGATSPRTTALGDGAPASTGQVVAVIDGDTVDVRLGDETERVRLLGIDTPESVAPDRPVECFGPEASARTGELLAPGTEVAVRRDVEPRDRYGRLLAYLWRVDDGTFVNLALVAEGFAEPLSIAPNHAHRAELAAAASRARASGTGRWGTCPSEGTQR